MRTKDHKTHVVENNASKVTIKVIILRKVPNCLGSEREGLVAP